MGLPEKRILGDSGISKLCVWWFYSITIAVVWLKRMLEILEKIIRFEGPLESRIAAFRRRLAVEPESDKVPPVLRKQHLINVDIAPEN
jgi:hypothetical protein